MAQTRIPTTNQILKEVDRFINDKELPHWDIQIQDARSPSISENELLKQNIKLRLETYLKGINLLLETLIHDPKKRKQINETIKQITEEYKNKSPDELSADTVSDFIAKAAIVISHNTDLDAETIIRYIKRSEQMQAWKTDRKPLVTISSTTLGGNVEGIIVQAEIPIRKLTPQQKAEFLSLKNPSSEKPMWFILLPEWQQTSLLDILKDADEKKDNIESILHSVPSSLRHVPGLANYSEHVLRVYEKKGNQYVPIHESHRYRSSVVSPIDLYHSDYASERQRLTDSNVAQVLFTALADRADAHANKWKRGPKRGSENTPVLIPVSIQTLVSPNVINSLTTKWVNPSNNNRMMLENKHQAVKKIKKAFKNPNKQWSQEIFKELGLTVNAKGAMKVTTSTGEPIWVKPQFISTNHPINVFRHVSNTISRLPFTASDKPTNNQRNEIQLLKSVSQFLLQASNYFSGMPMDGVKKLQSYLKQLEDGKPLTDQQRLDINTLARFADLDALRRKSSPEDAERIQDLEILLSAVSNYVKIPTMPVTNHHRSLFLSSLEEIITEKCGGLSYGSCKSGKDRKGLETLHTDAMLAFFAKYKCLPEYDDGPTKRKLFVEVCVELFNSQHQQEMASQNAPGAKGIKEITNILPKDILQALGKSQLSTSSQLAGMNKPSKLNKKQMAALTSDLLEKHMITPEAESKQKQTRWMQRLFSHMFSSSNDRTVEVGPKQQKHH